MLCVLLIGFCVQQAPGMEELIWEQYTVTLQKVSECCYIFSFQIFKHWFSLNMFYNRCN